MRKATPGQMKRYPELQRFDSPEDAGQVLYAWQRRQMKTLGFWVGLFGFTAGVGISTAVILIAVQPWIHLPGSMFAGVVSGVTAGAGVPGLAWFWRHRLRRFLRLQLVKRGIPICLKCGYDLRGQTEPRCPECGTPFDAKLIHPTEPETV